MSDPIICPCGSTEYEYVQFMFPLKWTATCVHCGVETSCGLKPATKSKPVTKVVEQPTNYFGEGHW